MVLRHARVAFESQELVDSQWKPLHYLGRPDFEKACDQYDAFLEILHGAGVKTHFLEDGIGIDSIYVRDASIATNQGMVICNMGKEARREETKSQTNYFRTEDIPVRGQVLSPGTLEGGDVAWINASTLGVGRGYRTNTEGIRQLKAILPESVESVVEFQAPHFRGPTDVFHLMSVFSPIDKDLAVIYSPLMSVVFREELLRHGFSFVEVPEEEYDSLGCNVLALAPRVCVMAAGNPKTKKLMQQQGVEVIEYDGSEISVKGCGGPTCLTRPLLREA